MSNIQLSGERTAEGSTLKKKLKRRSEVWDHFDETSDGKRAICKYCSQSLSGQSSGGTSHLKRHLKICNKCPKGGINRQLTLDYRDEVRNVGSTQKETWPEAGIKKAILAEIPFAPSESKKLCYSLMEPMDVEKEIYAYYEHEKEKLAIELNNLTSRVCLTFDIMEETGYLSLTSHFINADFDLVKKLISFKKLPDLSRPSIINTLESCLSEWKLEEKYVTFTTKFDIQDLIEWFGDYPFNVPCCKERLGLVCYRRFDYFWKDIIDDFGEFIEARAAIPSRIDTFNQIAKERGLSPINEDWFKFYTEHNNWENLDSSYLERLLKDMLIYKDVYSQYYALTETGQASYWQSLQLVLRFYGLVNTIINGLSSFKHPTSHLIFRKFLEIQDYIHIEERNNYDLMEKFHAYLDLYEDKNPTFIIASILDPRCKLFFFRYYYETELYDPIDAEERIKEYRGILEKHYLNEYTTEEANHVSSSVVGTTNPQGGVSLNNNNDNTYICPLTLTGRFSQYMDSKRFSPYVRGMSELDEYLGEKVIDIGVADFDLLGWWKQNRSRYPILSRMARDILAVPACVYSPKDAIKSDLKALEGVDPGLLEAVICSKDWILGKEQCDVSEPKN